MAKKGRTLAYKKLILDRCIQNGLEVIKSWDEAYRKLEKEVGREQASDELQLPIEQAMDDWLESTVGELECIWDEEKVAHIWGKKCTTIEDYLDRLASFKAQLEKQGESEENAKLIRVDTANATVTNLKNEKKVELKGTDYWKYFNILLEADGEKVEYGTIFMEFYGASGDKSKFCGDLKSNFIHKLLETGLDKEEANKLIIVKKSHQIVKEYIDIR